MPGEKGISFIQPEASSTEKGDWIKTRESLKTINHWIITALKPAWLEYNLNKQFWQAEKSASAEKKDQHLRENYIHSRNNFLKVLKTFNLPSNGKEELIKKVAQATGISEEERLFLKNLLYFENLAENEKEQFIKDFEPTSLMETISQALVHFDHKTRKPRQIKPPQTTETANRQNPIEPEPEDDLSE